MAREKINIPKHPKEFRTVKLKDLKPHPGNPRHNERSAEMVAESIKAYGYISPIVVSEDNTILAGHTRYKALKILGQDEAEVVMVFGLTPEEILGFVIADNRIGEYSGWNYEAVNRMIGDIEDKSMMNKMGMSTYEDNKKELENLINGIEA